MPDSNPSAPAPLETEPPWRRRWFPNNELALLGVLLFECGVFSLTGSHFLSRANGFEVTRLGVEVGLLALALTAIIITSGATAAGRCRPRSRPRSWSDWPAGP